MPYTIISVSGKWLATIRFPSDEAEICARAKYHGAPDDVGPPPGSKFSVSACDDHSASGLVGGLKGDAEQIITIHVTCIQAKH